MLEGRAEEGHLSASASSAHIFLPKNLWWHRGAAFHPQHAFHARRRQHRREFETPAHNLDLTGTAQSSRKAAADKRNECVRLLYKAVSPLGLFRGVGLAPCPSPPSLWSYRALEEKSGWRALHSAFPRERSGNFADRNTGPFSLQLGAGPAPIPHSAVLCPHSHRRQVLRKKLSTSIQLHGEKARGCVLLLCSRGDSRAWNISVSPCVYTARVPAGD